MALNRQTCFGRAFLRLWSPSQAQHRCWSLHILECFACYVAMPGCRSTRKPRSPTVWFSNSTRRAALRRNGASKPLQGDGIAEGGRARYRRATSSAVTKANYKSVDGLGLLALGSCHRTNLGRELTSLLNGSNSGLRSCELSHLRNRTAGANDRRQERTLDGTLTRPDRVHP